MKHVWSIDKLLKYANVLQAGTGKNLTTALCGEAMKPETFLDKKTIKNPKITKRAPNFKNYALIYNVEIWNFSIQNCNSKIQNLQLN